MTILVPEKRPDKTGKMVTRWVKPKHFDKPVPKNFAPPTISGSAAGAARDEDKEFIAEVMREFTTRKAERNEGVTRFNYYATDEQHAFVADTLREQEGFRDVFAGLAVEGRGPEDIADIAIMYDPEIFEDSIADDVHKHYASAMVGFRISGIAGKQKESKNLLGLSEDVKDKARKYARLDSLLDEEELHTSKALTTWIIKDEPYEFDSILNVIKEHRVTTPQEIDGIMKGIAPVLIDGAL
jgi:hypothetical protein